MSAVTMPELGESVTEGTVTRWLKQVGDPVALDEPLLEVSTDEVDTEIPSLAARTLLELVVGEDGTVAVAALLARVGAAEGGTRSPRIGVRRPGPSPRAGAGRARAARARGRRRLLPAEERAVGDPGRAPSARSWWSRTGHRGKSGGTCELKPTRCLTVIAW